MKRALKICLIAGVALALGAFYWSDMKAKAEKRTEEIRRAAIAQNRALISDQTAAVHDGPGRSLTGTESAMPTPKGWTKASAAFLATEARFAQAPETPPPSPNEVANSTSPLSSNDRTIVAAPAPAHAAQQDTPTLPGKADHEKPFDSAMLDSLHPVPAN